MTRYIDADKIPCFLSVGDDRPIEGIEIAYKHDIDKLPTADVVEVVRKSVKDYEGYYEVDQFGRVYSVDRVISVNTLVAFQFQWLLLRMYDETRAYKNA